MISVPGLVTRAWFLGHIVRDSVETRPGHRLTVDAPNSGDAPPFDMGAEVAAQWRPADTRILANG